MCGQLDRRSQKQADQKQKLRPPLVRHFPRAPRYIYIPLKLADIASDHEEI